MLSFTERGEKEYSTNLLYQNSDVIVTESYLIWIKLCQEVSYWNHEPSLHFDSYLRRND